MSKETGGAMKGYRRLRKGAVIKKGDVFGNGTKAKFSIGDILREFPCYRPLTKKPVEKWAYTKCGDNGAYMRVGFELRGVVYTIQDASLICKAVNKYLSEVGKNG
jgi:hypothetical protein